jgi:small subunit ribosomal protein S17
MSTIPQRYRKIREGIVVSDRMNKTRTIAVTRVFRHPLYDKVLRRTTTFHAHDEKNQAHEGDLVQIRETRPLSKLKRWRIVKILKAASSQVKEVQV